MTHSMSLLEKAFIWLGGYTPSSLAFDSQQEREPVTKLGATVLFAAFVAAINWAVGGWTYSAGMSQDQRILAACATAAMGVFLVLVFDRGLVYVIDTSAKVGRLRLMLFSAFRFVVVVAISSLTSQAVIPLLLGNELNIKALQLQEAAEQQRVSGLRQQFDLGAKEAAQKSADQEVQRRAAQAQTLPADIATRLENAGQCWQAYKKQRSNLMNGGMSLSEARAQLRDKASRCSQAEASAKAEQAAYFQQARDQLKKASAERVATVEALQTAQSTLTQRVDAARAVETANMTATSSSVLWELLRSNPGALGKWLLITLVLLVCELLPLLYKLQMGQTPPGRRIATENLMKQRQLESESIRHEHDLALQNEIGHASHEGMLSAMEQPEVRQVFADCFADTLKALAPAEAVTSMMRDLQAKGPDVVAFQQRYPQYAQIIGAAWRNAVNRTMTILTTSANPAMHKPMPAAHP